MDIQEGTMGFFRNIALTGILAASLSCSVTRSPESTIHQPEQAVCGDDIANAPDSLHVNLSQQENDQVFVPIDIERLEARVVIDVASREARAWARMSFRTGNERGFPLFDLRQDVQSSELDGVEHNRTDPFPRIDMGTGADSSMRAIPVEMDACTVHTLDVSYTINDPHAPGAVGMTWPDEADDARVYWSFNFSDLNPGRYLEQWMPSNLGYDTFPLTLDIIVQGTEEEHMLITNGTVEQRGENSWRVTYPDNFTTFSPMLILIPSSVIQSHTRTIDVDGRQIKIEIHMLLDGQTDYIPDFEYHTRHIERNIREFTANTGQYSFDRFVAFIVQNQFWGMEYNGATITGPFPSLIKHELFHSWYARGVRPATEDDGWIDEAWTRYMTFSRTPEPLTDADPPQTLHYGNPWIRETNMLAYTGGHQMFLALAERMGEEELQAGMRNVYREHIQRPLSTQQLESELYCESQNQEVLRIFHRFVYGREGEPPMPDVEYCRDR